MKKEFFATNLEEALGKAAMALGIPEERLAYQVVGQTFGSLLGARKVAIIVEAEEITGESAKDETGPSQEEIQARSAGEIQWAEFLLEGILKRMDVRASIAHREEGDNVILTVRVLEGALDLRRGVGRELRSAIQHLINRAVANRGSAGRKFFVDIGGTLEDRSAKMVDLARDLSERVSRTGKGIHIHLMDSQDRRLIHLGLVDHSRVISMGRGDKQFRVLSVEPKKDA